MIGVVVHSFYEKTAPFPRTAPSCWLSLSPRLGQHAPCLFVLHP